MIMANDFEYRLGKLEGDFSVLREYIPILYGYIDEVRANSLKLDRQHDEMLKRMEQNERRMEQNEEGIREQRELMRVIMLLHADTIKLIQDVRGRVNGIEDRLGDTGKDKG